MEVEMRTKNVCVVILVVIFVIVLILGLSTYAKSSQENFQKGEEKKDIVLASITELGNLPWRYEENSLVAVFICNENKLFIYKRESFSSEIKGCQYYIIEDGFIESSIDVWTSEVIFEIKPIVIPTPTPTETPP
jgi:amino acid permease